MGICPQRLSPPHSKGNPDLMPAQDPVPEVPVDVHSETNLLMVIVLLTEERPEPEWRQGWRCWSWICPYGIQRRIWPRQDGISSLCKSLKWFFFSKKPPQKKKKKKKKKKS